MLPPGLSTPGTTMSEALASFHVPNPPPGEDDLPYSDGEPLETERHVKQLNLLTSSLEIGWSHRDDFYVGGNMFIYFSEEQTKKNDFRGPDVFVVLDTVRREHKSWVVWQEGGRTPDVVIELLSPATEHVDRGEKMHIYAKQLHVQHYYLFDPETGELEGYNLAPTGEYTKMDPLPGGDMPCPRLGLKLGVRRSRHRGVEADWLRWMDEDGRLLPTEEEHAHAAEEQARIAGEQARIAGEQARIAGEQARAAEERANEEARLRTETERRLSEALAELERLKGQATSS
jgi:Uma2 family endonuclease